MTTQQRPTIDGLTGLRGIAALWVMIFHAWGMTMPDINDRQFLVPLGERQLDMTFLFKGWIGVDIFFVLSGFLLFLPFAESLLRKQKEFSLFSYFKRRALRIFPAYYAQLAILVLLMTMGGYATMPTMPDLMAHILMIHNFSPAWSGSINGVYWTLPIEFSFYLLLPLLYVFIRKAGWAISIASIFALVLAYKWMIFPYIIDKPIGYKSWMVGQLPGRLDSFLCGMVAAFLYQKYHHAISLLQGKQYLEWPMIGAGITGILLCMRYVHQLGPETYWQGHWSLFVWNGVIGFMIMLLVLGITLNGKLTKILFSNRIMIYIGTISYSIYLWHFVLLKLLFEDSFISGYINGYHHYEKLSVMLIIVVPLTLIVSALSYRYIEYPFLSLGSRKQPFVPDHKPALVKVKI